METIFVKEYLSKLTNSHNRKLTHIYFTLFTYIDLRHRGGEFSVDCFPLHPSCINSVSHVVVHLPDSASRGQHIAHRSVKKILKQIYCIDLKKKKKNAHDLVDGEHGVDSWTRDAVLSVRHRGHRWVNVPLTQLRPTETHPNNYMFVRRNSLRRWSTRHRSHWTLFTDWLCGCVCFLNCRFKKKNRF